MSAMSENSSTGAAKINGIYAAALTPILPNGSPDLPRFIARARHLLDHGCDGLAPLGTTGEANSISLADKITLIKAMADAGLPLDRMIIGTGSPALGDALTLSKPALDAGAQGLLLLPPYYYKNPSQDGLFDYFSQFVERLGGTPKIYLYHFPQMSSVPITLELTARLREAYPDIFVGLKDSSGDFEITRSFLEAFPGFEVFTGSERFLLDALRIGATGCISATTNVTAHLAQAVLQAWRANNEAGDSEQEFTTKARMAVQGHALIPALKAIMHGLTGEEEWLRTLPPFGKLDDNARREMFAALAPLEGFADLAAAQHSTAE